MESVPSGSSRHKLRKDSHIPLVGTVSCQIVGSKLPSNRQVLRVLFYNVRVVNLTMKESADLVIQEVAIFWQKARIPMRQSFHCVKKLLTLYEDWKKIQKNVNRRAVSIKEEQRRDHFSEIMDNLFDIAHADAISMIKIEEDREFLLLQRQKGRPGCMAGIDKKLISKEEKALNRVARLSAYKKRTYEEMEQSSGQTGLQDQLSTTDSDDTDSVSSCEMSDGCSDGFFVTSEEVPASTRVTEQFFTPRLSEVFDRCKITDRNAIYILMAAADAFGCDVDKLVINRTSIQHRRKQLRDARHE